MSYERILNAANDEVMLLADLVEDSMYKRIPKDKIRYYIDESMKIGIDSAKTVRDKYENIEELSIEENIDIDLRETDFDHGVIRLKGEYKHGNNNIIICKNSLKEMESAYKSLDIDFLDYDLLYEIFLAQGLFHYIQQEEGEKVCQRLDKVKTFRIIKPKTKSLIEKTDDMAANIFVKNILNLPLNPKILSYLFLLGTGKIEEESILEYLKKLNRSL